MNNTKKAVPKGRYLAYVRVSTPKQGEGVSLITQRETIARFAGNKCFLVTGWYEEKETAARCGRPIFRKVLAALKAHEADGLIVNRVDRSARTLMDWAELGELIDHGIPVYFAGEDLDMSSRSGRLAADIQAVVAADFIRNLREEAKRGIWKRLEQGLRPNGAPIGYLDRGRGKPKEIDPEKGPLVRLAFTWYATGDYTLRKLMETTRSAPSQKPGWQSDHPERALAPTPESLLHRLPGVEKHPELLPGIHQPLVSRELFFRVQSRLKTRIYPRRLTHRFKYSRMLRCATCGKCLVDSLAKGRVYYRCQTITCPTLCVREDRVTATICASRFTLLDGSPHPPVGDRSTWSDAV